MACPKIGPLTDALQKARKGQPPALVREWNDRLKHPGEIVFLCASAVRSKEHGMSWLSLVTRLADQPPGDHPVTDTPAANVERLLAPLAHEGRVRILQTLYDGSRSASELAEQTGYQGGALYHHLKELTYAACVVSRRRRYEMTQLGRQLLVIATCVARQVVVDGGREGLSVADPWLQGSGGQ